MLFAWAFAAFVDPSLVEGLFVFDINVADIVSWLHGPEGIAFAVLPAISTTDLVTEFGDYYINQGQNMQSLLQKLRMKSATPEQAILEYTENTVYRKSQSSLGEIVQAFQRAFTPKAAYEFKPKQIDLFRMKFDIPLHPDDIVGTWVGFLEGYASANKMTTAMARAEWPLVRYMLEMDVFPQMHDDLERKVYYKGDYVAPTANVAGATSAAMDGIRKKLTQGLTSHGGDGTIIELADWAGVNNSNIFDKAEEIIDTLDEVLEGEMLVMALSNKNKRAYLRDKRNTHGVDVNYKEDKLTIDFYDNCKIIGLPSMNGTDDIFITPAKNFKYIRRAQAAQNPKVEELKREVFVMLDWWEGIGFDLNELVYGYVAPTSGSGSGV